MLTKFIISISLAACIASCSLPGKKSDDYLQVTRDLTSKGKHEEALKRFIWFDDHILEVQPEMSGVRRSFALGYWKELGERYPPAMDSLKFRRDFKTNALLTEGRSKDYFADVVAINRILDEEDKSIQLFETLVQKYPALAKGSFRYIEELLLYSRRYDLVQLYLQSPMDYYLRIESRYLSMKTSLEEIGDKDLSYINDSFAEDILALLDYCKAVNDLVTAGQIQKKALTVINNNRIKNAQLS